MATKKIDKSKRHPVTVSTFSGPHGESVNLDGMRDDFDMSPLHGGRSPRYREGSHLTEKEVLQSVARQEAATRAQESPVSPGSTWSFLGLACDLYGVALEQLGVSPERIKEHLFALYCGGPKIYAENMQEEIKKDVLTPLINRAENGVSKLFPREVNIKFPDVSFHVGKAQG